MQMMDTAKLIFDPELYPRKNFDSQNITRLKDAIACGEDLPPIIVCEQSMRIVDGVHRWKAYQAMKAEEVPVEFRHYDTEADLFIEAVRLNAAHGSRLDGWDQTRCIHRAEELKITSDDIAAALRLPVDKAEKIRLARTAFDNKGKPVELKRDYVRKYQGRKIGKRAREAMEKSQGFPVVFHAEQILNAHNGGVIDWEDDKTLAVLRELLAMLQRELAESAAV
jgi:hypothetical protein